MSKAPSIFVIRYRQWKNSAEDEFVVVREFNRMSALNYFANTKLGQDCFLIEASYAGYGVMNENEEAGDKHGE